MSYARKNLRNVTGAIIGVILVAAIAIWQFYLFVTLENAVQATCGGPLAWPSWPALRRSWCCQFSCAMTLMMICI